MWINRRRQTAPASEPISAAPEVGRPQPVKAHRTQATGPPDPPAWHRQANVFLAMAALSNPTWSCRRNLVRDTIDIAQRCTHDTLF